MKKFLFLFLLILIMSCGRETRYQIQLFIRNESNDNISIILFPSEKFHSEELYYKHTDYRSGNRPSEFILQPNEEKDIFSSLDMNQKPYELARKVFDSIHISTSIG